MEILLSIKIWDNKVQVYEKLKKNIKIWNNKQVKPKLHIKNLKSKLKLPKKLPNKPMKLLD
jgi:hypothetical protein